MQLKKNVYEPHKEEEKNRSFGTRFLFLAAATSLAFFFISSTIIWKSFLGCFQTASEVKDGALLEEEDGWLSALEDSWSSSERQSPKSSKARPLSDS